MLKLMLVDDEPLVLVGLQSMLPWEKHGIELCTSARNGSQALELIEREHPDIVIADIKMPVMSGLELMTQCHEKYGRVPLFIILTSVEEYQYVKEALRGQAVDYLVKIELTPDMLLQSLVKAKDILHSLGRKADEAHSEQHGMQYFYDRFFMELFANHFSSVEQMEIERAALAINFTFDSYVVCCCRINSHNKDDADRQMSLYNSTVRMVQDVVSQYTSCYITNVDTQNFIVTFRLSKQEAESYQQLLQDVMERAMQLIKNYFNVEMECAVGVCVTSPMSLSDSYHTAQKGLFSPKRTHPIHFYDEDPQKSYIVEKVKEYVKLNIEKKVSLKDISEVFGYTPKYLSLLFAKHAGYGFVEYVTTMKIARARELLQSGDVRINEIAEQLGFENVFYFSKVFKKVEGVSPREYLSRIGGGATDG